MHSLLDILEVITKILDILIEASCIEFCDKIDSFEQKLYNHIMKENIKND